MSDYQVRLGDVIDPLLSLEFVEDDDLRTQLCIDQRDELNSFIQSNPRFESDLETVAGDAARDAAAQLIDDISNWIDACVADDRTESAVQRQATIDSWETFRALAFPG